MKFSEKRKNIEASNKTIRNSVLFFFETAPNICSKNLSKSYQKKFWISSLKNSKNSFLIGQREETQKGKFNNEAGDEAWSENSEILNSLWSLIINCFPQTTLIRFCIEKIKNIILLCNNKFFSNIFLDFFFSPKNDYPSIKNIWKFVELHKSVVWGKNSQSGRNFGDSLIFLQLYKKQSYLSDQDFKRKQFSFPKKFFVRSDFIIFFFYRILTYM